MFAKFLLPGLLTAGTLLGCEKAVSPPSNACYAGRVVDATCVDGVLIDVDARFPIGRPTFRRGTNGPVLLGRNVISVSNSQDLGSIGTPSTTGGLSTVGQRLYFGAEPDSAARGPRCFAADGVLNAVPVMQLRNISTTACVPTRQ